MKASELRIGNWVSYNNPCEIRYNDIFEMAEFEKRTGMEDNAYSPIPITQKWLKNMGFTRENYQWNFKLDLFPGACLLYRDLEIIICMDMNTLSDESLSHIKSVHQLQNLYFALTGKELTIKP